MSAVSNIPAGGTFKPPTPVKVPPLAQVFFDKPGFWAVTTKDAHGHRTIGVANIKTAGATNAVDFAVYLGSTEQAAAAGFLAAAGKLANLARDPALVELPIADHPDALTGVQSTKDFIHQAAQHGAAFLHPTPGSPGGIDWGFTAGLTAVLAGAGIALFGGSLIGAGAAGGAAAGGEATGAGAGAAGGAAAGGGAGGAAGKIASGVANNAGKIAAGVGAATLAGLFTNIGWWKGLGLVLAGAILLILAIRQMGVI